MKICRNLTFLSRLRNKIKREGCTEYEQQPSFFRRFFLYSIMRDREKWRKGTISQIFFVILSPNSEKTLN